MQITTDTEILETILIHATSASRLAGCINDASDRAIVIDTIAASIDEIVRTLAGLLGNPHPMAAPVPSARSTFALDVAPDAVPEHVAPDAPAASRTISIAIEDGTRHELVRLSDRNRCANHTWRLADRTATMCVCADATRVSNGAS